MKFAAWQGWRCCKPEARYVGNHSFLASALATLTHVDQLETCPNCRCSAHFVFAVIGAKAHIAFYRRGNSIQQQSAQTGQHVVRVRHLACDPKSELPRTCI